MPSVIKDLATLPLSKANPYMRNLPIRQQWLEENVRESCVFEGARGLLKALPQRSSSKRRSIASAKNTVKAA